MAKKLPPQPPLFGERLYNYSKYNAAQFICVLFLAIAAATCVIWPPAKAANIITGSIGTDASANPPTANTNNLVTFIVTNPGEYYIENQCTTAVQVIYGNGINGTTSNGNPSIQILNAAAVSGQSGGNTGSAHMDWFSGQIQVNGAAGCAVMVRHN